MVNTKENFWASRSGDGQDRSHLPPMPVWVAIIRVAQLIIAVLLLVLTAFAASRLGSGAAGFGLTWFTFVLTVGTIVYIGLTALLFPKMYNYWAHIILESLTCIFWLATWAVLASEASALNVFFGYNSGIPGFNDRRLKRTGNTGPYYDGSYYPFDSRFGYGYLKPAIDSVKAAAAIGALEWVLFCVTLGLLVAALLAHRNRDAGQGTTGTEAAVTAEPKGTTVAASTAPATQHTPAEGYYAPPQRKAVPAQAGQEQPAAPYPGT